jgi:hypothetical protein
MVLKITKFFWLPIFLSGNAAFATDLQASASVGGDLRWFDWREHQNDKQLLREAGPLGSARGELHLQYGSVFTRLSTQWGGGRTYYDGHLQSGPVYTATAWEAIAENEWQLGWQDEQWEAHFGVMQRDWRRFVNGSATVSSAKERYRWRLITTGGELALWRVGDWQVNAAADIGVTIDSEQKVYSASLGNFSLEPGKGLFWRLALPLQGYGSASALRIEPYYQQQNMRQSNAVIRFDAFSGHNLFVYQPASIRREFGVTMLWKFDFGFH